MVGHLLTLCPWISGLGSTPPLHPANIRPGDQPHPSHLLLTSGDHHWITRDFFTCGPTPSPPLLTSSGGPETHTVDKRAVLILLESCLVTSFFYPLHRQISSMDSQRSIHKIHNNTWDKRAYPLIAKVRLIGNGRSDRSKADSHSLLS